MRRAATWACVLLALVGVALAATGEAKSVRVSGQVVSVEVEAGILTVAVASSPGQPRNVSFEVGPETKIVKASKPIQLAEVNSGDQASVTYKSADGKHKAVAIEVETKVA